MSVAGFQVELSWARKSVQQILRCHSFSSCSEGTRDRDDNKWGNSLLHQNSTLLVLGLEQNPIAWSSYCKVIKCQQATNSRNIHCSVLLLLWNVSLLDLVQLEAKVKICILDRFHKNSISLPQMASLISTTYSLMLFHWCQEGTRYKEIYWPPWNSWSSLEKRYPRIHPANGRSLAFFLNLRIAHSPNP